MLKQTATNLVLQALTLASKTVLLLVLARYLSVADVGVFGILAITIALGIHFVGLDFYAFNTREILARREVASVLIRDQAFFHLASYLIVVPATVLIFAFGVLPWGLLAVFVGLLLLEHIAQELQRLLFTLSRPIPAATVLFLRGGLWIWVLVALFVLRPGARTVAAVCVSWLVGAAVAIVFALYWLRDLDWSAGRSRPIDWRWVRRGLRVSLPLLGSSLAFRMFLSVDRYVLQHFWGSESVGVYTFYANIRNAIHGFLEAGVLLILRPQVVAAREHGDRQAYRGALFRMSWMTIGLLGLLALAAIVLIDPVLRLVGTPAYAEHKELLWPILVMTGVLALAEVPHTALYAQHRDRALIWTGWLGLLAAVILNLLLVPGRGPMGAALATLLAGALTGLAKLWLARRPA